VIPFTELQLAIYKYVDEPYCITIMRRMMMRIAVGLAKKNHCLAIATGEAIGQVASQTLESMDVINEVTNFPILRPLCTLDKLQIIQTAERIGTFEISIRPYEDCCTIFKPKAPKTHPHLKDCEYFESKFDWAPLVQKCIEENGTKNEQNPVQNVGDSLPTKAQKVEEKGFCPSQQKTTPSPGAVHCYPRITSQQLWR
jgi:thiamine biosynthesis protein ThiI